MEQTVQMHDYSGNSSITSIVLTVPKYSQCEDDEENTLELISSPTQDFGIIITVDSLKINASCVDGKRFAAINANDRGEEYVCDSEEGSDEFVGNGTITIIFT